MSPDQLSEFDVARFMADLRAESAGTEGTETFSVISRGVPRPNATKERSPSVHEQSSGRLRRPNLTLDDLLGYEGDDFINKAYVEILGRRPDLEGSKFYSAKLYSGRFSKIEILEALQNSAEGRKRGVHVDGLARRARWQRLFRLPVVGYVARSVWLIVSLPRVVANLRAFETHVRVQLGYQADQLRTTDRARIDQINALTTQLKAADRARIEQMSRIAASQKVLENRLAEMVAEIGDGFREETRQAMVRGEERLGALIDALAGLRAALAEELDPLRARIGDAEARLLRQGAGLLDQERRLTILLEEARRRLPQPFDAAQLAKLSAESGHMLDRLYLMIEDRFRGTRADIKSRQKLYVPDARRAVGDSVLPIVDLGCGRGEWLELMREAGLPAIGVDMNDTMIGECRALGLDVVASEALDFLRGREPGSLSAVSGFHIIEHMPFARLIALVDEALRALKPGGMLLFETPNPSNILVSTHNFHIDPTHLKPLPSVLISALLEARGFVRIEIRDLFPHPNIENRYEAEVLNDFNRHFYGPQDYGVIGWKPAE